MLDDILFQEQIYNLANGYLDLVHHTIPESEFVKDEFAAGSYCHQTYGHVQEAYDRLCSRLGCGCEDADLEIILSEMENIAKYMSIKMFQYGVFFARRETVAQSNSKGFSLGRSCHQSADW